MSKRYKVVLINVPDETPHKPRTPRTPRVYRRVRALSWQLQVAILAVVVALVLIIARFVV